MLKSIHYTRGFAALLVVLFHFSFMYIGKAEPFNTAFLNGGFGVDLFFSDQRIYYNLCHCKER